MTIRHDAPDHIATTIKALDADRRRTQATLDRVCEIAGINDEVAVMIFGASPVPTMDLPAALLDALRADVAAVDADERAFIAANAEWFVHQIGEA